MCAEKQSRVKSDCKLAKEFAASSISEIKSGKRGVSVELTFNLAITLELDPATVVADLESQREKKREVAGVLGVFYVACTGSVRPDRVHAGVELFRYLRRRGKSAWWC